MRSLGAARLAVVLLTSGGALVGCGGSEPASSDSPPAPRMTLGEADDGVDCPEREVFAAFNVNVQLVSQYPEVTPTEWGQGLGTMDGFASQIESLQVLTGDDVQAALALFAQADQIVQRGIAGDPTAGADLKALLGTDAAATLQKKVPIALTYSQQCP